MTRIARMKRRDVLRRLLFLLVALAGGTIQAQTRPPNIVLIMADDLGRGHCGCYGQTKIRTPNIDRIAAEGMKFNQFYCGANVCAPFQISCSTLASGTSVRISKIEIIGRKRTNRNNSVRNNPIVPMKVE